MKKAIILTIFVILVVSVGVFAGIIPFELSSLGDNGYNTGFSMSDVNNCETNHFGGSETLFWMGNVATDYQEVIFSPSNNAPIVTAMSRGTGERSIDVVLYGNIAPQIPNNPWQPDYGWYKVDIKYSQYQGWQTIINTKDNQVDTTVVSFVSGSTVKQRYYAKEGSVIEPSYGLKALAPITFSLNGPHVGIIRVRQYTEFSAYLGLQHDTKITSEDYTFLISGEGNVDIVNGQTRYIEGVDTVKFSVTTGYSGYTQGGQYVSHGWELKIYNNYGDMVKKWNIGDDKLNTRYDVNGKILNYPIPSGSFNPSGSNTWSAVLTNTLFNQDDETFFAISKEALQQAPDIKPIRFDDSQYNLGDSVTITLEGIPNPEGRNTIDGFLVNILYGRDGIDYVVGYHLKYIKASFFNNAQITFTPSKGDTYITIEAWAFDYPESEGGIMSEKAEGQIWIKDKEHQPVEIDYSAMIIAIVVFIILCLIAFIMPLPVIGKILIVCIGAALSFLIYLIMIGAFDTLFGGII